eukprot:365313-Chlamydomonas_euryale.AAC.31
MPPGGHAMPSGTRAHGACMLPPTRLRDLTRTHRESLPHQGRAAPSQACERSEGKPSLPNPVTTRRGPPASQKRLFPGIIVIMDRIKEFKEVRDAAEAASAPTAAHCMHACLSIHLLVTAVQSQRDELTNQAP